MSELAANEDRSLSSRAYALIFLFYFSAMSIGAGQLRALTQHEVFAAEPAREMLHGATCVMQTFAGVPRYEKPPAISWLQAVSFAVFGIGEYQARLPSILAGAWMVLTIAGLTARLYGRKAGIIAGLMQATVFYTVLQARLAESDMTMVACVTTGMVALGWAWVVPGTSGRNRALLGWAFAISAGSSCMIKPPAGVATMYLGALALAGLNRSREQLWWVLHPGRLALFAVIGSVWPVAAYLHDPMILQQWKMEAEYMTGQAVDQREPFWFYTWNVPMMAMPWVMFCIPLGVAAWRSGSWRGPIGRYVAAWMVPGFIVLSLAMNKHKHYCMPILPPLTMLSAAGTVAYLRHQYSQAPRFYGWAIGGWVGVLGAVIVGVLLRAKDHPENIAAVVGVLLVGGAVVLALEWRRREGAQLAAFFATAWGVIVGLNVLITPVFDNYGAYRSLAREMAGMVPAGKTTYTVGLGQSQVSFYLSLPQGRLSKMPATRPAEAIEYAVCAAGDAGELRRLIGGPCQELLRGGTPGSRPKAEDVLVLLHFGPPPDASPR
jgi:4-amino-4-deoxy-L-arabinose transferase-like glycosyltransferase